MATSTTIEVPEALLRRIIEVWNPQEVRLFGSRARGTAHERSDWDLMVIVDDDTPDDRLGLVAGFQQTRGVGVRADVIPIRRSDYDEERRWIGMLAEVVDDEGITVYAR